MPAISRSTSGSRFILFLILILAFFALGQMMSFDINAIRHALEKFPPALSGLIFVPVYVVLTTLIWFGPKDVLRISAAILFGATTSTVFISIAEWINAIVLFYMARFLGRDMVKERFRISDESLDRMSQGTSWLWPVALRLNPLIPLRVLDLGFGLSGINVKTYFIAAALTLPVRIYWVQFILAGVGEGFLEGPDKIMIYLSDHPAVVIASMGYFLAVLILTLWAGGVHLKNRKVKAHGR